MPLFLEKAAEKVATCKKSWLDLMLRLAELSDARLRACDNSLLAPTSNQHKIF